MKTALVRSLFLILVLGFVIQSCHPKASAVDERKRKLEKKKKHDPTDCPKLDC